MATLDDVETGVTQALASMLFPGAGYLFNQVGTALAPYTNTPDAPVLSMPAKLYPGDPNTDTLDKDLHLGTAHIAVQHAAGYSRDTTRFLQYRTRVSANVASLSIATQGNQAVLGGVCGSGQVVAITAGKTCYAYLTVANDTIASVMAALAANIHGAIASGAILTAPGLTAGQGARCGQRSAGSCCAWQSGERSEEHAPDGRIADTLDRVAGRRPGSGRVF
jgi:hypothetical protein